MKASGGWCGPCGPLPTAMQTRFLLVAAVAALIFLCDGATAACSNGQCKLLDDCSSDGDCEAGLYCSSCLEEYLGSKCVRSKTSNPFQLVNNSLPFNKYAFLTTHNSYAIKGEPSRTGVPRVTFDNQEDSVTDQLNNGVRALMLDTYDYDGDVWLCHSFKGKCHSFTAFEPAIDTFNEIATFMAANPSEIVTLILEDYVQAPNGLTKVFNNSGLLKYWFPVSKMPTSGGDWPLVKDMVAANQRLLVFTSQSSKQDAEGIAYQWSFMVENQYGDGGMNAGSCFKRAESAALTDTTKSLVLVNFFPSVPVTESPTSTSGITTAAAANTTSLANGLLISACQDNSQALADMVKTCYAAASNRWANFVAVDYYKRSGGVGAFQVTDTLNGELLCGCGDVHACMSGASRGSCSPL